MSRSRSTPRWLVRALLDPLSREFAELAAERAVASRGFRDVVLGPVKLEVAVPRRPGSANVAVERHSDTTRVEELRVVQARSPELLVAVAEDDGPIAHAVEEPLVVILAGRMEAVPS